MFLKSALLLSTNEPKTFVFSFMPPYVTAIILHCGYCVMYSTIHAMLDEERSRESCKKKIYFSQQLLGDKTRLPLFL